MRGVKSIARREDFASVEHAPQHLLHQGMILTSLPGKFFGTHTNLRSVVEF